MSGCTSGLVVGEEGAGPDDRENVLASRWRDDLTIHIDRKLAVAEHLPEILYHYTSIRAFHEIVSSGQLHATQVNYMADASEVGHGRLLLQETIRNLTRHWSDEDSKRLTEQVLYSAKAATGMLPGVYAVCLSERGDDVGQWERYAENGRGVAIGFSTEKMPLLQRHSPKTGPMGTVDLDRVIYDEPEQRRLLEKLVSRAVQLHDEHEGAVDFDIVETLGHALSVPAMRLVVCFKQDGFAAEREWRLVYNHPPGLLGCQFKVGTRGLQPYVSLAKVTGPGKPLRALPLRAVTMGPRQDSGTSVLAALSFLSQHSSPGKYAVMSDGISRQLSSPAKEALGERIIVGPSSLHLRG